MYYQHALVQLLLLSAIDAAANTARLLVISLDGFRHDYLNKYELPTLNEFRNQGIRANNGMRPTFTTMTFPNHISIATGMYQEDHGVIHNTFYDRLLNKSIGMSSRDEGQWSDPSIEPIWITATKQNVKSAVLFWPACHNQFNGVRPLIYTSIYSDAVPYREKIDSAIRYFRELPIQLVMLYHFEPDKQGHTYGPDSPEVRDTLFRLDNDTKYLLDRVKEELNDDLNIIILSDHGMTNVTKVVRPIFEKYLDRSAVESTILSGALFNVMPRRGRTEEVLANLSNIPNVTVYKRDEMPERFHYSKPKHRLGELTALPDIEGQILSEATTNSSYPNKGNHGWDNTLPSMQAIFMARGPSFSKSVQISSLNNVDIYHIVCQILKLNPNPNATAGSLRNLTQIFMPIETSTSTLSSSSSAPSTSTLSSSSSAPSTSSTTPTTSRSTIRTTTLASGADGFIPPLPPEVTFNKNDIINLNPKILCWIPTTIARLDRARAVTWGKRCDRSLFLIAGSPPTQPLNRSLYRFPIAYIGNDNIEKYDQLSSKVLHSLHYIYNRYRSDYDWFFKGDDDTFVIVENLRHFLRRRVSNQTTCYGYIAQTSDRLYPSGGAGYVLSQATLIRLGEEVLSKPEQLRLCLTDQAEDINIAYCLARIHVYVMNLRDENQLETFHPMTFEQHYLGKFTKWIERNAQFPQKKGDACCSPLTISFHSLSIDEMRMMHFLLYRIQKASD
ncbi:unnamed protein product [Adineta ricciae]|uniref:Uncharacterized protein n=1 Tax=Adineta ricciae TaxID=249248 RepID=A0A815PXP6_ADIRI|nr:unnamed protein product [Adineta ricciae]